MRNKDFERVKRLCAKSEHSVLSGKMIDNIVYDREMHGLYLINTNLRKVMFCAAAAMTMDGAIVKNRLTGAGGDLPIVIKQLFDRGLKMSSSDGDFGGKSA